MPEFAYKAIRASGQVVEGVRTGVAEMEVAAALREQGFLPLEIESQSGSRGAGWLSHLGKLRGGLAAKDRLAFGRQLASLVRAGVPLDRSLALARDLAEKPDMAGLVETVLRSLRAGKPLADSLSACGGFFPPLYVAMVRAGEASGTLPAVLDRIVEFEEFSEEMRAYLISAMIYPAVLLTVGGAAIAVLLGFVVPRFAQVFEEAGRALPLPTWVMMQVAAGVRSYGWLAVIGLVAVIWGIRSWTRTEAGRLRWDRWKLEAPLAGPVWRKLEVARFAKTLGTLLAQAVPIVSALRLTQEVVSNRVLAGAVEPLLQGVKRGQGLAAPLAAAGLFPPLAVQLTALGEQTGKLDAMLLQVAEIYDKEVRVSTKRLVSLIEPAVILVMGLVVGAIVTSTLLAIVSINEVPF